MLNKKTLAVIFRRRDKLKCLPSYNRPSKTKKVERNSKPLQLGLSLVKRAQSHQFIIKKRCVRKIKSHY